MLYSTPTQQIYQGAPLDKVNQGDKVEHIVTKNKTSNTPGKGDDKRIMEMRIS